jgi:hypothetical protein
VVSAALTAGIVLVLAIALAPAPARAQGWMHFPVDRGTAAGHFLTQGFYGDFIAYCGARDGCGTHNGYDYGVPVGTPLYAVAPGVVDAIHDTDTRSSEFGGAGLWVRVRHDATTVPGLEGTFFVATLHMSRIDVVVGQAVDPLVQLGLSGNTGGVAAHLHLHLSTDGTYCPAPVDPGCPSAAWVEGSVISDTFIDAPGCQSVCMPVPILWIQPARYGGEDYPAPAGCDPAGPPVCDGDVLLACDAGTPVATDCTVQGQLCRLSDDAAACVDPGIPDDGGTDVPTDVTVATDMGADTARDTPAGTLDTAPPRDQRAGGDRGADSRSAGGEGGDGGGRLDGLSGGCSVVGGPPGAAGLWLVLLAALQLLRASRRWRPSAPGSAG